MDDNDGPFRRLIDSLEAKLDADTFTPSEVNAVMKLAGLIESAERPLLDETIRTEVLPELLASRDSSALRAPDVQPVEPVYDGDGARIRPGDRISVAEGDPLSRRRIARLCVEQVYVLRYFEPGEDGVSSRMIRHRPQAELAQRKAFLVDESRDQVASQRDRWNRLAALITGYITADDLGDESRELLTDLVEVMNGEPLPDSASPEEARRAREDLRPS